MTRYWERILQRHPAKHLRCWMLIRRGIMPRWRDDGVAQMLGIAEYGCPLCGYGATEERKRRGTGHE